MKKSTEIVRFDASPGDPLRPTSTPIYQTATFEQRSALEFGAYDYSRSGNPTRDVLERQLARLEGAAHGFAFASGMAAIATAARLAGAGGEIVAGLDLYGGTYRFLSRVLDPQAGGSRVRYAETSDLAALEAAISDRTRLVLVETPTNPLARITDIAAAARIVHERGRPGAILAVDNSFLSPYLQNPLEFGADLVVHSATKYLSGHADVTAGFLATNRDDLAREIAFVQNAEGAALSPFDSWLVLRGSKTLAIRVERQERTATRLAEFLAEHPAVRRVHHPGLASHPGRDVHFRQARGAGAVVSFETGSVERSRRVVEALELFTIAVSFGSLSSTASLPAAMSHASIPAPERLLRALPEDLVRLSIGIEDPADLQADLSSALEKAVAPLVRRNNPSYVHPPRNSRDRTPTEEVPTSGGRCR